MMMFDVFVDVAATLALFMFMFIDIKHTLQRWQGGVFVAAYVLYIVLLVLRELKF